MGFLKKIGGFFLGLGSFMARYLKTEAARMVEQIGPFAKDVAEEVERQSRGQMPGTEKFSLVKTILLEKLAKAGIAFTTSAVHSAIENAVIILQDEGKEVKAPAGSGGRKPP
jgi:uncharacterized protein involved in cysteine biosynthesis